MATGVTYYGRPIEELTRDELLEALESSVMETARVMDQASKDMKFMSALSKYGRRV